jgi:D-alanyl-lipoteichoic acid acyltransferase DltB (MBOAT superfamily)
VAGPIERATHLLPQVKIKRHFDFEKAKEGVYQFLWGLVKKVVIADTCATYANAIFDYHSSMNSLSLILGAVYFAFQIYGDFSGYSDMALGMSKLFGIDLLRNFNYPYFSRYSRVLASLAHFAFVLVPRLFVHSIGREQWRYGNENSQHLYYFLG